MKKIFLATWFIFAFAFASSNVQAQCDCAGHFYEKGNYRASRYRTAYEEFQNAAAVFVGRVIAVRKVSIKPAYKGDIDHNYEVTFEVKKSWKKATTKEIVITQGQSCIIGFKEGEEYLVYASLYKDVLWASYCSRTRELVDAGEDLKEFEEKGEKPQEIVEESKPGL